MKITIDEYCKRLEREMGLKEENEKINQLTREEWDKEVDKLEEKTTEELLNERGKTHGCHRAGYALVADLWHVVDHTKEFLALPPSAQVELKMILFKLGRYIIVPNTEHTDDIKGYAELMDHSCGLREEGANWYSKE